MRCNINIIIQVFMFALTGLMSACFDRLDNPQAQMPGQKPQIRYVTPDTPEPEYTLSLGYTAQGEPRMQVELRYVATWDEHVLYIPERSYRENLQLINKNINFSDTKEDHVKKISAPVGTLVELSYWIRSYGDNPAKTESFYAPVIGLDYINFVGHDIFIIPSGYKNLETRTFKLKYKMPADFALYNSFGAVQNNEQIIHTTTDNFRESVFVGGSKLRVIEKNIRGKPVAVAIQGQFKSIEDHEWADLSFDVLNTQRSSFGDELLPFYLVSIWAHGKSCSEGRTTYKSRGRAHYNAVRAKFAPLCPMTPKEKEVLSHEFMHSWIPAQISTESKSPGGNKGRWLSEGWTDYYGFVMAYRSKVTSLQELFKSLNYLLVAYKSSPMRNTSLRDVGAHYEMSSKELAQIYDPTLDERARKVLKNALFQLPYQQGVIMLLRLNHMIKLRTNFEFSFDSVIHELLAQAQQEGGSKDFSVQELSAVVDRYAGPGVFEGEYEKILNGALLEPPELGECAGLVNFKGHKLYAIKNPRACAQWFDK